VTDTYRYDAFGATRTPPGPSAQPFRFTGEQRESESGLYYLRARYYDPAIGRFVTGGPFLDCGYPTLSAPRGGRWRRLQSSRGNAQPTSSTP